MTALTGCENGTPYSVSGELESGINKVSES